MEHKNTDSKNVKENKTGLGLGLVFISLVFFIRAGYYFFVYMGLKGLYYGEWAHQSFSALFLLISFFFLLAGVGSLYRKKYAYYLSWLLVLPDILLGGLYTTYTVYALTGIPLTLLIVVLLVMNRNNIKPLDKTDKKTAIVITLIFLSYVVFTAWALQQPNAEEYQKIVTAEAIQKNDITICDKLVIGKDYCLMEFAQNKGDHLLCEKISSEFDKDLCYLHIANSIENPEICKLIKDDYNRGMCHGKKQT